MMKISICYYEILGVPRTADVDHIRRTFRRLALEHHPDRNPGDADAERRFKAINNAHQILTDPARRQLYDEFGEAGLQQGFDPERARVAARLAVDPRKKRTDVVRNLVVDDRIATNGGRLVVQLPRIYKCRVCAGSGTTLGTCSSCAGGGSVATEATCRYCTNGWFFGAQGWVICPWCWGTTRVRATVSCPACAGAGGTTNACNRCQKGKIRKPSPVTINVPKGVGHGQFLRLAGMAPSRRGDLYLRVLRKRAA